MDKILNIVDCIRASAVRQVQLTLPIPPSTNHLYRSWRRKVVKSANYKRWLADADLAYHLAGRQRGVDGPALVVLIVRPGRGWSSLRDMDNLLKPVQDWLVRVGLLQGDHCRLVPGCLSLYIQGPPTAEARLDVIIFQLEEGAPSKRKNSPQGGCDCHGGTPTNGRGGSRP